MAGRKRRKFEGHPTTMAVVADNEEYFLETRDASPAHFLTKIKSFSMLSKHGISQVESMEFKAGDYKWKLIIYPDGDEKGKEVDHISVLLSAVGSASLPAGWEVNAVFNLFIYNHIQDNYLCFRDPSNGYLFNDNCVFGAEVFVIKNHLVIEDVSVLALTNTCKREWVISNFSKQQNVWSSEEFAAGGINWKIQVYPKGISRLQGRYISIFLECVDSETFAAHKKVKAACRFIFRQRSSGQEVHSKEVSHWYTSSSGSDWGFPEFMEIGEVSKGFIVNDSCHLGIQLSVQVIQEAA